MGDPMPLDSLIDYGGLTFPGSGGHLLPNPRPASELAQPDTLTQQPPAALPTAPHLPRHTEHPGTVPPTKPHNSENSDEVSEPHNLSSWLLSEPPGQARSQGSNRGPLETSRAGGAS